MARTHSGNPTGSEAFSTVFDRLADAALIADASGTVLAVNPAFELLTGHQRANIEGMPLTELIEETGDIRGDGHDPARLVLSSGESSGVSVNVTPVAWNGDDGFLYIFCPRSPAADGDIFPSVEQVFMSLCLKMKDRAEFLDSVVEMAVSMSGCRHAGIRVLTRERYAPYEARTGFPDEWWKTENMLDVDHHECACSRVLDGRLSPDELPVSTAGGSFFTDDIPAFFEPLPDESKKNYRAACGKCGFRSMAIIPIRSDGNIVGALHLADERPGTIGRDVVEFFEGLNDLIGDAITRFDMEEELNRTIDTQRVINEILKLQVSDMPLDDIIGKTLDLILSISWLAFESRGVIFLYDETCNSLRMVAERGIDAQIRELCSSVPIGRCLCGKTIETGEVSFVETISSDHEILYSDIYPHGHYCIPIRQRDTKLGVLTVYIREGHVRTRHEEEFLVAVANTLAEVITRTRTERRLESSDTLMRMILDAAGEGLYGVDADGVITFANPAAARMTGWTVGEMTGRNHHELLHVPTAGDDETPGPESCPLCGTLLDGKPRSAGDGVMWTRDGGSIETEFTSTPLVENGEPAGAVVVFKDITERKRIERERSFLASIVESTDDIVIGKKLDGTIVSWNHAAERKYGYTASEMVGRSVETLVPPEMDSDVPAILDKIRKGDRVDHYDTIRMAKDGTRMDVTLTVSPIVDTDGHVIGASAIARDVTQQKRAETALRESELKLRAILNNSRQSFVLLDSYGRIQAYNTIAKKRAQAVYGIELKEGDSVHAMVGKSDFEDFNHIFDRAMAGKNSTVDKSIIGMDGSVTWFSFEFNPVLDNDGKSVGVIMNTLDITERMAAKESLEKNEEKYRLLAEYSTDMISRHDADGVYTYVSPACRSLMGYDPEELIGRSAYELFHPDDLEKIQATHDTIVETPQTFTVQYRIRKKDGSHVWFETKSRTFMTEGDEGPREIIAVSRDITDRKTAEDALKKSEARLANAQRISRMGNWEWDIETNDVYWSEEIFRIYGLKPEEFTPTYGAFINFIHPDDREFVLNAIDESLENDKPYNVECRIVLRNGVTRVINGKGEVIRDEQGNAKQMLGTVQDISDQKLMRKQHARLASFPELNPYPIIETDLAGSVTYLNPEASSMFPEILVDGADHPILGDLVGIISSISYDRERNIVIETRLGNRYFEQRVSYIPESKRLRSYIIEITERKQAEQLKENMSRLKDNLISALHIISGKLDLETALRETLLNAKRLTQAKYAAFAVLENNEVVKFLHDGMTDRERAKLKKCPPMGGLIRALINERRTIRVDSITDDPRFRGFPGGHTLMRTFLGTPIVFRDKILGIIYISDKMNGEPFTDQDEEIFESMAAHAAVAINNAGLYEQIKRFNEELEEMINERTRELEEAVNEARIANNAKSEFLANMSHELRTPLNAIIGFAQLIEEKYFGPLTTKQDEFINNILVSAQHLLNLINDILDLSKVEAGKMELDIEDIDIQTLIDGSLVMIKEKAMKHDILLDVDIGETLKGATIKGDERKLKQIMFNLLSNAAKYTQDGGSIKVSASISGHEVLITVSDTGVGIAPEHLGEIFEEFYQVNDSAAGKPPGTGLGLSLVKRFVGMHDGRVWVESDGPGRGSTFGFSLPMRHSRYDTAGDGEKN